MKTVIRVLRYEGPDSWLERTMEHNAVQRGVHGKIDGGVFKIQEITFPGWLSHLLGWFASRQPSARMREGVR